MTNEHPTLKKWTTNFINYDNLLESVKGTNRRIPIVGDIYDHPDYDDGETIHTSYVTNAEISDNKLTITTISGSKYFLDQPCEYFVEFVNIIKEHEEKESDSKIHQNMKFDTPENKLITLRWFLKMGEE